MTGKERLIQNNDNTDTWTKEKKVHMSTARLESGREISINKSPTSFVEK